MADLHKYPDPVWDRFFNFAFGNEEGYSRAEVQDALRKLGIDLTKALGKVKQALQTVKAKEELAAAKSLRPGLIKAMSSVVGPLNDSLRDNLCQLIKNNLQGGLQAAYYRKLEAAATDQDLQSLLEDMYRLEALERDHDDAKPSDQ